MALSKDEVNLLISMFHEVYQQAPERDLELRFHKLRSFQG